MWCLEGIISRTVMDHGSTLLDHLEANRQQRQEGNVDPFEEATKATWGKSI